ncbi:hypothetical protein RF11_16390 [Thelohanellus kitauei]|uniref:ISXO2-like transposase domain-containing protein n=1 Tax=Thelohanellus kitauei TaxID=669202 RepID=A0A0C2MGX9_THEKT|nr:hypothetical protein RF11_16390 [Thelohanellus kitauei]
MDRNGRANCMLAPEKILQAAQRSVKHSKEMLDVSKLILIDWFNHCCEVCRRRNLVHFSNHLLRNGNGQRINGQTPDVVIKFDETLLRGKRHANVGRLLGADENISREEIEEWEEINKDGQLVPGRNHGRRITGLCIFGLVECHRQVDRNYKSGEVRLFVMEKGDQESLLSIIRRDVAKRSIIWSDMWFPYMRIGQDGDGLIHEYVNNSERFVSDHGVHTQNIETVGEIKI